MADDVRIVVRRGVYGAILRGMRDGPAGDFRTGV